MGFRFRKSIKLAPGIRVNIGKRGASSVTIGRRGSSISVGKSGTYVNTGIPGSGLSYRAKLAGSRAAGAEPVSRNQPSPRAQKVSIIILMAIVGGGLWTCSQIDLSKPTAASLAQTAAPPASSLPWHAVGAYAVGMSKDEAIRRGAAGCTVGPKGEDCTIPNGKAFGAPYSRGHVIFAGSPSVATRISVAIDTSAMPAVIATLGAPSIRKGGSRKILYWSREGDLVVSRLSETMSVSAQPGLAPQLIPRK